MGCQNSSQTAENPLSGQLFAPGEKNISFKVEGRENGAAYQPQTNNDSKLGLVLIQEWWGLNKSICRTADAYAELGFRVLTPDIYRGKVATSSENAGHLMGGLDWPGAIQDIAGAVKYLKEQGCTKVGVLGFCMGGALAIVSAVNIPEIDATAPFYGVPDLTQQDFKKVKGPMYAYFGEKDDKVGFSSPQDGEKLKAAALEAGVAFELKIVPGANHAFMNVDSPNHHPEAYKTCIKENGDWFKKVFSSEAPQKQEQQQQQQKEQVQEQKEQKQEEQKQEEKPATVVEEKLSSELLTAGEKNATFPVEGKEDGQAYLSPNNADSQFGLVLLQEWWGLNKSICKTGDAYASHGFRVLVPDFYRGQVAKDRENAGHLMGGLDWAGAVGLIAAAVKYLKAQGCTKVGVLGFCMGGALTIASACNIPEIDASAPFYGVPDLTQQNLKNVTGPMFAYFGENDPQKGFSSPEDGERLKTAALEAGLTFELKIVPGAGHAFMNVDSPNHHPEAYKTCIKENTEWFTKVFSN